MHIMFALAGVFLILLAIPVTCVGIYQAIRRRTWKTLVKGLVLFAVAYLMLALDHSLASA